MVKVTTINSKSTEVIGATKNEDVVFVRLEERAIGMNASGFLAEEVKSDFAKLNKELAKKLVSAGLLKAGANWKNIIGQDCKIVIKESTTPFYDGMQPKINPTTGEVVTCNGSPIYRRGLVTTDLSDSDTKLANDKVEASVLSKASDFVESKAS